MASELDRKCHPDMPVYLVSPVLVPMHCGALSMMLNALPMQGDRRGACTVCEGAARAVG